MSIPELKKDLNIIQSLSDLPNATDGLSAAELKAKFDEAALEIKRYINNDLLPNMVAENIPFKEDILNADNVQAAIEEVFQQIADASSGTISNGSVTKAKLASALLARVFGGRAWISADRPGESDNPDSEFPVGQVWLRPPFVVQNLVTETWSVDGCSAEVNGNSVKVTGNNQHEYCYADMNITQGGNDGDRVFVLFDIREKDGNIKTLTVSFHGEETAATENAVHETNLSNGALTVRFRAEWQNATMANGSFTIENLTIVNVDSIMRSLNDCKEIANWGEYLQSLLPFITYESPRELYIQTKNGVWQQFNHEVFPVSRGGTGCKSLDIGEMLYGNGTDKMEVLPVPMEDNCFMRFSEGLPAWTSKEGTIAALGSLCIMTGDYTGTGEDGRELELPVDPKLLYLFVPGGSVDETNMSREEPVVLANGAVCKQRFSTGGAATKEASVDLNGGKLTFHRDSRAAGSKTYLGNREGVTYNWVAIY